MEDEEAREDVGLVGGRADEGEGEGEADRGTELDGLDRADEGEEGALLLGLEDDGLAKLEGELLLGASEDEGMPTDPVLLLLLATLDELEHAEEDDDELGDLALLLLDEDGEDDELAGCGTVASSQVPG